MGKRLDYRKLMEQWMQYYSPPPETTEKIFAAIWDRLQKLKEFPEEKGVNPDETHVD